MTTQSALLELADFRKQTNQNCRMGWHDALANALFIALPMQNTEGPYKSQSMNRKLAAAKQYVSKLPRVYCGIVTEVK